MSGLIMNWGHWLILAGLLLIAELTIPGAFFLWIACAAALVSGIDYLFSPSFGIQLILFAILAPSMAVFAKRYFKKDSNHETFLNRRSDRMIGMVLTLSEDMVDGRGSIKVGDSVWPVSGPQLPRGSKVKVMSVEGNTLFVIELKG